MIEVYIDTGAFVVVDALQWCEENDIAVLEYRSCHSENAFSRAMIYGFTFFFENEEDAVAFKLRWR